LTRYREQHLKSRLETELELGAKRLLSRAEESYGLKLEVVSERLRKGIEKYLVSDDPDTKAQEIAQFLDEIHATDLCIVVACETGDEKAWSDLITRFGATVRSAARSVAGTEDAAEDLSQSIWAELHGLRTRDDKPSGKIGYYSGRGSLGGWLRAVVGQWRSISTGNSLGLYKRKRMGNWIGFQIRPKTDRMFRARFRLRQTPKPRCLRCGPHPPWSPRWKRRLAA